MTTLQLKNVCSSHLANIKMWKYRIPGRHQNNSGIHRLENVKKTEKLIDLWIESISSLLCTSLVFHSHPGVHWLLRTAVTAILCRWKSFKTVISSIKVLISTTGAIWCQTKPAFFQDLRQSLQYNCFTEQILSLHWTSYLTFFSSLLHDFFSLKKNFMWNTVTIQYNPLIEEEWDEHFKVTCEYGYDFWKTVTFPFLDVE